MPAFDTLKATKLLKASGFEETQAEAVVATVRDAVSDNVATKADMGELRAELKTDIGELRADMGELRADMGALRAELKADVGELRAEFKADIAEFRASMYRMVLTTSLAVVGATVSLVKLLP